MAWQISRAPLLAGLAAVVVVFATAFFVTGSGTCPLQLVIGSRPVELELGVQRVAATTCAVRVEVNGESYYPSSGAWLDEETLILVEYGTITRANRPEDIYDTTVYALAGVDPARLLVTPAAQGRPWAYVTLFGSGDLPPEACRYADDQYLSGPEPCQSRAP